MKKCLLVILMFLTVLSLTGCGNQSLGFGNFTYKHVHCTLTNECYTIEKWYDSELGMEVDTVEYGSIYFSEGTYILFEDECPVCGK